MEGDDGDVLDDLFGDCDGDDGGGAGDYDMGNPYAEDPNTPVVPEHQLDNLPTGMHAQTVS